MIVTADLLRAWGACWSDTRIAAHLRGRPGLSPREVAEDESISLDDRLWVVTRCLAHLDEAAARLYAIESAELVAHLAGDEDDQAQYLGILNELRQIEIELPEAERSAARTAARTAAWGAARGAAMAAARDAAWGAARGAAWGAARGAAMDAAWDAELRKAISRALEWLGDGGGGGDRAGVCTGGVR